MKTKDERQALTCKYQCFVINSATPGTNIAIVQQATVKASMQSTIEYTLIMKACRVVRLRNKGMALRGLTFSFSFRLASSIPRRTCGSVTEVGYGLLS